MVFLDTGTPRGRAGELWENYRSVSAHVPTAVGACQQENRFRPRSAIHATLFLNGISVLYHEYHLIGITGVLV